MKTNSIMLILALVPSCHAQLASEAPPKDKAVHERAEDAARTVPGGASKGVEACHEDIERFCKGVKAGEGRLGACLKAREKELSDRCLRWASHGGATHAAAALFREIDGGMMESYDIRDANPYGAKLSTKTLNKDGAFKMISIAIPAGQELSEHSTPGAAVLFVVEGEARFIAGPEDIRLAPGTVLNIPPGRVHRITATRDTSLILVR
jgi:quercetin dioxygenase-like cupin family protein